MRGATFLRQARRAPLALALAAGVALAAPGPIAAVLAARAETAQAADASAPTPTAGPGRERVLKQVRVPHHYYYREMYLPQAASGVSSPAWSPDGRELAVSIEGGLWRVNPASGAARQLTSGPGYDYQPDWSPDGRRLVYTSYRDDALELRVLELASGWSRPLTANGAVNLDPRWSPDGTRIAFVSTLLEGRFHVFVMAVEGETSTATAHRQAAGKPAPPVDEPRTTGNRPRATGDQPCAASDQPRATGDQPRATGDHLAAMGNEPPATRGGPGATRTARPGASEPETVAISRLASDAVRLTEDRDSGLPRYYYSRFDQYLSPSWSPDGTELLLVSNRGRISGSGGLWRMRAEPGAPLVPVQDEETTWKARPDWARDGRRVVYSSYRGRQWHQLFLVPAEGGDVFPLTYGDFDATEPRFSPDGRSIAYVSNESGTKELWLLEWPGGARRRVAIRERERLGATGRLVVEVSEDGRAVPARVSITTPDGRSLVPEGAWRHADDHFDRAERRIELGYFHVDGQGLAEVDVPAGPVTLEVTRGLEYRAVRRELDVAAGATRRESVALERIAAWPRDGWWSGDLHVHMNYGGAYRATPRTLRAMAEAEDLRVVFNLVVNKEERIPDVGWFTGRLDPSSTERTLLRHDQEFHTSFWGHLALLGLRSHLLLPDYAAYAGTAAASPYPANGDVADLARAQGALVGYVHPFDDVPDPGRDGDSAGYPPPGFASGDPLGLPADVALGKVDFYEAVGLSDHRATNALWYRLLNCGFRIPAGAGTDAMTNFASLRGPVGMNRVYVKAEGPLAIDAFLAGLKAGRTMATNGPLVELWLRPRGSSGPWSEPGDAIELPAGRHALEARVRLRSIAPVDRLEIVRNGEVAASVPLTRDHTSADATLTLPASESGWYLARAHSDRSQHPVLDFYPFGTTSPVYVTLGGAPLRSSRDARYFVAWLDGVRAAAAAHRGWNTAAEKDAVLAHLERARAEYQARAED